MLFTMWSEQINFGAFQRLISQGGIRGINLFLEDSLLSCVMLLFANKFSLIKSLTVRY